MRPNAMGLHRKSGIIVSSGVVQGSVFPPLFSLFINDITSFIVSCRYHLYADDVQLYISCRPSQIMLIISVDSNRGGLPKDTVCLIFFMNERLELYVNIEPYSTVTLAVHSLVLFVLSSNI
jgi:hypothetical protein